MWFKQAQIFKLADSSHYSIENLTEKLEQLTFSPCPKSMPSSMGWVSTLDDDSQQHLARAINGYTMICLQIEEKILPATVVRQELIKKSKEIESAEDRKLSKKEKLDLKDEITMNLLQRAFSKLTKVYAYIDSRNHWLVIGTSNTKKTEHFLSIFKKTITENIYELELKKLSPIITNWLKHRNYPSIFSIEKSCVLQDAQKQNRIIRCQQQDLFASSIQSLIKDGCEVKQLALVWQDRINFVLSDDFLLHAIHFKDEITGQVKEMEPETMQQQFDADFLIMSEALSNLLKDLFNLLSESHTLTSPQRTPALIE